MEWGWARVFSTFGPLDNDSWLLPTIADALIAGQRIPLSPGDQLWSYLPGWDAGRALARIALAPAATGIYNVGHPTAPRLRTVIELFASALGSPELLGFGDIELTPSAIRHLEPDTSRLESIGWSTELDLSEALAESAAWFTGTRTTDHLLGGVLPARPKRTPSPEDGREGAGRG
jgi:nucleoside-diphosphate-sugar epimerase